MTDQKIVERYYTVPHCARILNIKTHSLRNAINRGEIPSYFPFGKRRYVLISEVNATIQASRNGGAL